MILLSEPRYVIIGYPHTSNWDFLLMILFRSAQNLKLNWVGKKSLFRWPYGWIMKALGGIPVDRLTPRNFVAKTMQTFRERDRLFLGIAPEGTRKKTEYWRRGFYHIAAGAGVPIALGFIDRSTKTIGIGKVVNPSGNLSVDMEIIREFYRDKTGINPDQAGIIQVKEE
ncbi:MAG TPA: 1-acyl-sn-glycerol-3-phosphate acyltransferase [Thermoanaerobaculia bacterium]|nr:1-acyl-sn-glycerol-3-phosphate acyltransferase [Thermoanaerobaculia bacterium]HUM31225.1 1-acyl-sn-glycerol-3-phosphate acyltransferase [Thermoanaerobaculia bacterium]HXK69579.1 1-acyl-sn-glycerol-3-phosphate acyltransferase [Thermoanaerobaculia bacterium]